MFVDRAGSKRDKDKRSAALDDDALPSLQSGVSPPPLKAV